MRLGVLGNCQAPGVAASIQAWTPHVHVVLQTVVGLDMTDAGAVGKALGAFDGCDLVLLQRLEDRRPELIPLLDDLQARHDVLRYPVLAFRGFHPDCGHLNRDGRRIGGAMGPYHSLIACAAWLEGLPPYRAAGLFNAFTYSALGYFDLFAAARARLLEEAAATGYDLSPLFADGRPAFMHTVNHPTAVALHLVAAQALELAGLDRLSEAPVPPDALAEGPIWPIYPEVAARLALSAPGPDAGATMRIVEANHAALEQDRERHGPIDLETGPQPNAVQIARARDFIREFVVG